MEIEESYLYPTPTPTQTIRHPHPCYWHWLCMRSAPPIQFLAVIQCSGIWPGWVVCQKHPAFDRFARASCSQERIVYQKLSIFENRSSLIPLVRPLMLDPFVRGMIEEYAAMSNAVCTCVRSDRKIEVKKLNTPNTQSHSNMRRYWPLYFVVGTFFQDITS